MTPFALHRAATPQDAIALLEHHPGAALLAGGTTLLDLMKLGVATPAHLIDVTRIGLDAIECHDTGWRVGAMVRNTDLAAHAGIRTAFPLLAEAVLAGASTQLRNMATVGGNLMQRTRCAYFRDPAFAACNKRAPGSGCAAIGGLDRAHAVLGISEHCTATHPGDMAVALAALDATVRLAGPAGERALPFVDFNLPPGDTPERETACGADELIVGVDVPHLAGTGWRSRYRKVRERASYEFALVSCAVALEVADGTVRGARVALGGVATKPWRCAESEAVLAGAAATPENFARAAEAALAVARPGRHNGFKIDLARRTLARTLADVAGASR